MIETWLKIYKNLVEVEITDFKWSNEILYWEWTRDEFAIKYQTLKAISFPMHWWKTIAMQRVQGFDNAKWNDLTVQHLISWLDDLNKKIVQIKVNNYTKDHNIYPTQKWIINLIERLVYPNKAKEDFEKLVLEWEKIRKEKIKRINYFNWLSEDKQNEINNNAWNQVFKVNDSYKNNKHLIKAKILFTKYKNDIITDLMQKI